MVEQHYMCDWCMASASTISEIKHTTGCPQPELFSMMEQLIGLNSELDRLRAENERMRVENQELREEKEVPCKLRMFVWEDFCSDYTSGLAFAIAPDLIDAKKMLEAKGFPLSGEEGYWGPVHEFPATQPIAFAVAGGA